MRDNLSPLWKDLVDNLSQEFWGLFFILVGGFAVVSLRTDDGSLPWLVQMLGWTAPWFTFALILLGLVLILGQRAGYWSVEAIVGAQILFLSLTTGTFAWNNTTANLSIDWNPTFDGRDGGLVGWALGSLLVSSLGQWPAVAFVGLLGLVGLGLLLRYTPLIYASAFIVSLLPLVQERWLIAVTQSTQANIYKQTVDASSISTLSFGDSGSHPHSFVSAQEPIVSENEDGPDPTGPDPTEQTHFVADRNPLAPPIHLKKNGVQSQKQSTPVRPDLLQEEQTPSQRESQRTTRKSSEATKNRGQKNAAPKPLRRPEQLPPIELMQTDSGQYGGDGEIELARRIEQTLEDFNVPVQVVHIESGPTVTQFGVEPLYLERAGQRRKVRVNRIVSLADDLALALEAPSVRIEAPVPGRPYVGIEVPNRDKVDVTLRGLLESKEWRKDGGHLTIGLGRNTAGKAVVIDLARAPHMLIAGATGAGKSVCINTIITSLLMQHGPESLQFVMVDPKMVELPGYNGIPHLLGKAITDMDQVMGMLTWLLLQMDDRYRAFKEVGVRNIFTYNSKVRRLRGKDAPKPLPFLVLIVDELADLMMTAADDVERQLCRLAQMARATGIHLILATQRPSTDVVTGLIKANFPTRIAFAVTSQIDSRVILDVPGAERLLGQGDMLLMRSDESKLMRVQGCWVADEEINAVVNFWKQRKTEEAAEHGQPERPIVPPWFGLMDRLDDEEELILDAIDVLRDLKTCSTSLLQRKLQIGYPKAARMMEELESRKIVGPDLGGGQGRQVLLKKKEIEEEDAEEELF
ncbi:DNA translocase FtsK [Chloroflexi bacterium TSY]|nr:DNA translocase FtsK [Chloroflexi bacterium TSY]